MILNITHIEEQIFQMFKLFTFQKKDEGRSRDILGNVYTTIFNSYLTDNQPTEYEV